MKSYLGLIAAFVLLFFLSCSESITISEFEEAANTVINDKMIAGYSVSIFDKDTIHYSNGFGYSQIENSKKYDESTQQIIASVSKLVIALSIMKAVELGLINLDDDVNLHLPFNVSNPNFPDVPITIRQLTNHTSSIGYSDLISGDYAYSKSELSLRVFCENFLSTSGAWYNADNYLNTKPGSQYEYSNIASSLAASIIEYKSEMSFKEFTDQYIFKPLELSHTRWYDHTTDHSQISNLYELNENDATFKKVEKRKIGIYPVRDLTTSIQDLSKIGQLLLNKGKYNGKEILGFSSIEKMLESTVPGNTPGLESIGQGVFWIIDKNQLGVPSKVIGHSGGDDGIFTMMWINVSSQKGYILLSNTGRSEANIGALIYLWRSLNSFGKSIN